eukprot:3830580-Prymnesium_polylepis.1
MLDCGIRLLDCRFLERGVEAHGRVDLCFPPAFPFVCVSFACIASVRGRRGGWLALACARVGGGRSSLC